jgi:hypothetical protein
MAPQQLRRLPIREPIQYDTMRTVRLAFAVAVTRKSRSAPP